MKIVQVIHGVSDPSSGPTYYVARLTDEFIRLGQDARILSIGAMPADWPYQGALKVHDGRLETASGVSHSMLCEIRELSREPVILHGHGVWRFTNLFPLFLRKDHKARIVWSTHGAMSSWSLKYKRILKVPFWHLLQRPALQRIDCFHVTAQSECEDVRQTGVRAPVALIPIGVDILELPVDPIRRRRVVFLGRIDRVKGVDMLVRAWAGISGECPGWELVIAGPLSSKYAQEMKNLALSLPGCESIRFVGEVLGAEKTALLSESMLLVLPSHSENFGVAIAEALAHGMPVITTTATPWAKVVERKCGWYITPDQESLADSLRDAMARPHGELHAMGEIGREWMKREYSWNHIAGMMLDTYGWLLEGAGRPDFVLD